MKNKIMIDSDAVVKRRVALVYGRAFARLDEALAANTPDEGPTDRQKMNRIRLNLFGVLAEDANPPTRSNP